MKKIKNIEQEKQEIQTLGLNAIKSYFKVDVSEIDKDALAHIHQKAKIGMSFEKEMNVNKRSVELNYLRVFRLYAEDKKELRRLIRKSMSSYLPK